MCCLNKIARASLEARATLNVRFVAPSAAGRGLYAVGAGEEDLDSRKRGSVSASATAPPSWCGIAVGRHTPLTPVEAVLGREAAVMGLWGLRGRVARPCSASAPFN
jgi:hypothetical protein